MKLMSSDHSLLVLAPSSVTAGCGVITNPPCTQNFREKQKLCFYLICGIPLLDVTFEIIYECFRFYCVAVVKMMMMKTDY